ncbi:MAG TPA: TraM recognition domain-containing protein [Candidatus Blautia faecipullorum]|nr:TraM recognition domain-containing protein [Candidatus Blautia faecipullorum]
MWSGGKARGGVPEAYLSLFGKIPEFPQKISTCRKYNISTTIVLQSIAQIKMLYKDDYETIIGNCVRPEAASAL